MNMTKIFNRIVVLLICATLVLAGWWIQRWLEENRILQKVIQRLSADTRIAEVLVTKSEYDEDTRKVRTTIKFLEYDTQGNPLEPKYFTFRGNIIQFQSLVIRFKDKFVKMGDQIRGKSIALFTKVFVLDENDTQIFNITPTEGIPDGYKIPGIKSKFEDALWQEFWKYALDPAARDRAGVKNAQIEAPGTMFLPGTIYRIYIEHDGGIRIDSEPMPEILKGEKL